MELNRNKDVYFDELTHCYLMGDRQLIGVTTLLKKHGLSANYSDVPKDILSKAAARGSAIHKAIERYCKTGINDGAFPEVEQFRALGLDVAENEYLISDNEAVASSIDVVLADGSLADIKTTAVLHIGPLTWQLSIYAYLFERQTGVKVPALYGIHIRNGKAKMVEVQRIDDGEIEKLLECERRGQIYAAPPAPAGNAELAKVCSLYQYISELEQKQKKAKEDMEKLKAELYTQMARRGLKTMDSGILRLTRILPSERKSVDGEKLKAEYPEVYGNVIKTTKTKGTIKITLRDE